MKTQCPNCLNKWTGTIEEIFFNDRICKICKPNVYSGKNLFNLLKSNGEFWTWDTLPMERKNSYENAVKVFQ
jgi:hypothetical protein